MEKQKNSLEKKSLFEFFGIDAKDKDNNKVQEEKSDEHYIKIAEEYSKDLEERIIKEPKKFRSYKNRIDAVENALFKNSLCKVFCLIADGVNYNDAIAKEYYRNKNEKFHNPKVTSIYLKELRDAKIIKRGRIEGRKQIYEIDWNGLFNILRFRKIMDYSYGRKRQSFKISNRLYNFTQNEYSSTDPAFNLTWLREYDDISEIRVEQIIEKISNNFFRPYIEEFVKQKLSIEFIEVYEPEYKRYEIYPTEVNEYQQNLDAIDFTIYDILNEFDTIFSEYLPDSFEFEIKEVIEASKDKKLPDLSKFILQMYKRYYESKKPTKKSEFNKKAGFNPKYKLLSDIINEFTKDGIKIEEEVKKDE